MLDEDHGIKQVEPAHKHSRKRYPMVMNMSHVGYYMQHAFKHRTIDFVKEQGYTGVSTLCGHVYWPDPSALFFE